MTAPTVFISYSQVSADQFIAAALTWFGDPDPTQGSPWDKGERLEANPFHASRTHPCPPSPSPRR
jgi:hypothetical protein